MSRSPILKIKITESIDGRQDEQNTSRHTSRSDIRYEVKVCSKKIYLIIASKNDKLAVPSALPCLW